MMERKKLIGDSSYKLPSLGFGCAAIGGYDYGSVTKKNSLDAISEAWNSGVRFFDVSDIYGFGNAESTLSSGLGSNCKEAVIATKFGLRQDNTGNVIRDCSLSWLKEALHASLKRLNIEHIPIYLIHWYDEETPFEDLVNVLNKYKSQGKIGRFGACNFSQKQFHEFGALGGDNVLQLPFSLVDTSNAGFIEEASKNESSLTMAYDILGRGILTGKYTESTNFLGTDTRAGHKYFIGESLVKNLKLVNKLKNIANNNGITPSQVAIRWVIDIGFVDVALVGCKTPEQVLNNLNIFNFDMTESDSRALLELANQ